MMMKLSEPTDQDVLNEHPKSRSNIQDIAKTVTEILPQRFMSDVSSEYTFTSSDDPCFSTAEPKDLFPGISPKKMFADTFNVINHLPEDTDNTIIENFDKKEELNKKGNKKNKYKIKENKKINSKHNPKEKSVPLVVTRVVNERGDILHQEDHEIKVSKDKKSKQKSILGFHIGKVKIRFKKSMKKLSKSKSQNNPLEGTGQNINELHGVCHDIVESNKLSDSDAAKFNDAVKDDATTTITLKVQSKNSFYDVKTPSYTIMQQETKVTALTPELYIRLSSEESANLCGPHITNPRSPLAPFTNKPSRQCSKCTSRRDSLHDPLTNLSRHPTPRCSRRVIEPETKAQSLQCGGTSNAPLLLDKRSSPDVGRINRGTLRKRWHLLNCCTPPRHNPSCCSTKCHKPSKCCTTSPKCYTPSKCCTTPTKCSSPPKCRPPPKYRTPPKCATPRCKQKYCETPKCYKSSSEYQSSGCPQSRCCPTPSMTGGSRPCPKGNYIFTGNRDKDYRDRDKERELERTEQKNQCSNDPVDCTHKFCKLLEAVAKVNSELDSSIGSRTSLSNPRSHDYDNLLGIEASTNNLVCELRKLLCLLESKQSSRSGTARNCLVKNVCKAPRKPKCYDQIPRYSFCDGGQSNSADITMDNSCTSLDSTSFTGDATAFSASTSVESFNFRRAQPHPYGYDYHTIDNDDPYAYCTPPKTQRCAMPYVTKPRESPRPCSRQYKYDPPHFKAEACGAHSGNYPPPCNYSRPIPKQDVCGRGRVVDIEIPLMCPVPTRKAACPGSDVPVYEQYSENSICDQLRSLLRALERNGKKLAQFDTSLCQLSKTESNETPLNINSSTESNQGHNQLNGHQHNTIEQKNTQQWRNRDYIEMDKKNHRSFSFCELGQIPMGLTTQKESSFNEICSNYSSHSHLICQTRSNILISSHNSKIHPKVNIFNSILSNFCYEQTRNIYQGRNSSIPSKTKLKLNLRRFASMANATGLRKYLREILSMYDQPRDKTEFEQTIPYKTQIGNNTQKKQSLTFYGQVKQHCNPKIEYCCGPSENRMKLEEKLRPVCCTQSRHFCARLQENSSPTCPTSKQRTSPQRKSSPTCSHKSSSRTSTQQMQSSGCWYQAKQRPNIEERLNTTCRTQLNKRSSFQYRPIPLCCSRTKHIPNLEKVPGPKCCTQPKKRSVTCCNKSKQPYSQIISSPIRCGHPKPRSNLSDRPTPTRCCNLKQKRQKIPIPTCCSQPKKVKNESKRQCQISICCNELKKRLILLQKQLSSTCCIKPKQKPDAKCCNRPKPRLNSSQNKSQSCSNNDRQPINISDCVNDIRCKIFKLAKLLEKIESYQSVSTRNNDDESEEAALQEYSDRIRCDMLNILNKIERNKNITTCGKKHNIQYHQNNEYNDNNERKLKQNACKKTKNMRPVDNGSCNDIITDNFQMSKKNLISSNPPHHTYMRRAENKVTNRFQDTCIPYYGITSNDSNELETDEQSLSSIIHQKLSKLRNLINEKNNNRADDSNDDKQNHNIESDEQSQSSIAYDHSKSRRQTLNKPELIKENERSNSYSLNRIRNEYEEYYSEKDDDECSIGSQTSRNTEMVEETQRSHDFLVQDEKDDLRIAFLPLSNDAEVNRSLREEITEGRSGAQDRSNSTYETNNKNHRSPSGHRVRYSDEDEVYYTNTREKDTSCQCDLPCDNILDMSEDDLKQRCHGFTYEDLDTIYKRDIVKLKSKLTQVTSGFKFKKNRIESHLVPNKSTSNNIEENKEKQEKIDENNTYSKEKNVAYSKSPPFHFFRMIFNIFKKSDEYRTPDNKNKCKRSLKNDDIFRVTNRKCNCGNNKDSKKQELINDHCFRTCEEGNYENHGRPAKHTEVYKKKQNNQKCQGCGVESCTGLGPPGVLPKPRMDKSYPTCIDKDNEYEDECKEKVEGPIECACKIKGTKIECECPASLCPETTKKKKKINSKPPELEKKTQDIKNTKRDQIKQKPQTETIDKDNLEQKETNNDTKHEQTKPRSIEIEETESQTLDSDNKALHVDACECFDCGCTGADDENCNCSEEIPMDCSCTNEQNKGFKLTVLKNPGKTLC